MKAVLVHTHTENSTGTMRTFWFKPERPLRYIAGQFVELTIPHQPHDERKQSRWFTLSSSPTEAPLVSITTGISSDGSSFKAALANLETGASIFISEAMGDFTLPKDTSLPLVFVALHTGATPFRSIIRYLIDRHESRSITLLQAAHTPKDLIFQDLFTAYPLKQHLIFTDTKATPTRHQQNKIESKTILDTIASDTRTLLYIAGPEGAVESLSRELIGAGMNSNHIIHDFFHGYDTVATRLM